MRDVCEHSNGIMSWLFSFSEAASCTEGTSSWLVGEGNHSIDSSSVVVLSLWCPVCEHGNGIMKMPLSWLFSFSEAASCTEGTSSSLVGEGNHSIDS